MELFYEPRNEAIEEIDITEYPDEPEMSEFESAFLCGLIRKYKPKKILEVGIAGGATTAIILKCMEMIQSEATEVYSVDISKKFYHAKHGEESGFLADPIIKRMDKRIKYSRLLGKLLPEQLSMIGNDIDFVILDTMHVLPGEVLDFLAVFPYLKQNAIVVVHDISLNNIPGRRRDAYASKVLLDTVIADKFVVYDDTRKMKIPNIAAFQIIPDTKKYISNVFSSLTISWGYMISDSALKVYHDAYKKYYSKEQIHWFLAARELNNSAMSYNPKRFSWAKIKRELRFRILERLN